jgi:hypothetical protein
MVYRITEKATLKATQSAIPIRFFEVRGFAGDFRGSPEVPENLKKSKVLDW